MPSVLNRDLLAHNTCFGCGLENPAGLHIEVSGEIGRDRSLHARFTPTQDMIGFPGITHGGAIYTALDCLSTWVATVLGPDRHAAWVLRSASTVYHHPAPAGEPLTLTGRIAEQGGANDPLTVAVEARRQDGTLCVDGAFKVVPLAPDRLTEIAGIEALPENWRAFLAAEK
jgi:acyl-coenzyme A thioesterase PaaI-like protein